MTLPRGVNTDNPEPISVMICLPSLSGEIKKQTNSEVQFRRNGFLAINIQGDTAVHLFCMYEPLRWRGKGHFSMFIYIYIFNLLRMESNKKKTHLILLFAMLKNYFKKKKKKNIIVAPQVEPERFPVYAFVLKSQPQVFPSVVPSRFYDTQPCCQLVYTDKKKYLTQKF